ncbi:mCG140913, partial [Mus musculus]
QCPSWEPAIWKSRFSTPSTSPSLDTSFPVLAAFPATASSARSPRSNRSQTPPSPLSSQGNLTLASRRREAPTYSLVVQLLAKLKLRTPLPGLGGRGFDMAAEPER